MACWELAALPLPAAYRDVISTVGHGVRQPPPGRVVGSGGRHAAMPWQRHRLRMPGSRRAAGSGTWRIVAAAAAAAATAVWLQRRQEQPNQPGTGLGTVRSGAWGARARPVAC